MQGKDVSREEWQRRMEDQRKKFEEDQRRLMQNFDEEDARRQRKEIDKERGRAAETGLRLHREERLREANLAAFAPRSSTHREPTSPPYPDNVFSQDRTYVPR
jgi:predicted N-acyltransferase